MQRPNRLRIRPIQHVPAVPSYLHKLHLQQHPQVLRHRRLLKSQPHHNFPDRPFPRRQKLQYFPPPRFRHRIKRIRRGCRPRHVHTLHSHMGICQAFFVSHDPSPYLFLVSPPSINFCVPPPSPFTPSTPQSRRRSLLPQRPSSVSFRAKQTGFFLLLRSCEVAGLRRRGISLRLSPSTRMR
jgi:hypothetical protein